MSGTQILLALVGNVALLLWAVRMIRTGVARALGARLRALVAATAGSRTRAFVSGLGVTLLLQSSTATALIVASFAARGTIGTAAGLAVMLGADVGTAVAAQLLARGSGPLSPLLITAGLVTFLIAGGRLRQLGRVLIGLGLVLLALQLIAQTAEPLRGSAELARLAAALAREPLIALLLAALLTWLAHSSLAVVLLASSLAAAGVVTAELALALVLGANLGSGIAPVVATAAGGNPARRVPVANALLRATGALLALALLPLVGPWLAALEPAPGALPLHAHLAFNLALAALALPLAPLLARAAERALPDRSAVEDPGRPRYLDEGELETPGLALASAAREGLRLGDVVQSMLARSGRALSADDPALVKEIRADDDVLDRLNESIKLYLTRLGQHELDAEERQRCLEILTLATNLENVGDVIDKNLMGLAEKRRREAIRLSVEQQAELAELLDEVAHNLQLALNVFTTRDLRLARELVAQKAAIRAQERRAHARQMEELEGADIERVKALTLHLDLLRDLKRINTHLAAIGYPLLEAAGELRETRLASALEAERAGV